jgi:glycerophosphoryl diester phosphodiesterase
MTSVIAHRGASTAFPENTIAAFEGARRLGADWVELDARRSGDGGLIVHHDAHLGDGSALVDLVREAIPPSIPDLDAALDACRPLGVNIEIKNLPGDPDFDVSERVAAAVVELLDRRGGTEPVLVSSFNLDTVDRVRALDPSVPTAWLRFEMGDVAEVIERTAERGHAALHPWDPFVDGALVALAHEAGLAVNTWTVDDPDRMRALVALGVDGIVTNVPDVARRVVGEAADVVGVGESGDEEPAGGR